MPARWRTIAQLLEYSDDARLLGLRRPQEYRDRLDTCAARAAALVTGVLIAAC